MLSQNSKIDSLKSSLLEHKLSPADKMPTLADIARLSLIADEKLAYADELLKLAKLNNKPIFIIKAQLAKGTAFRLKGDLKNSLESLFMAAKLAVEENEYQLEVEAYSELSITYTANNEFRTAINYNKKSIETIRKHGSEKQLAINLLNTGYSYYTLGELDSALFLYNEAEPIFEKIQLAIGRAYTIGNRALVHWKQDQFSEAENGLHKALDMLEVVNNRYALSDYNNQLANVYLEQNKIEQVILHSTKAIDHAEALGLKEQLRDAYLLLSKMYTLKEDYQEAFNYQSKYHIYKDSLDNIEQVQNMADLRTDFEVSIREKEIDLLENQKALQKTYIIIAISLFLLASILLLFFRQRFLTTRLLVSNERKEHSEKIKDLLRTQESRALHSMIIGRDNERKRVAQEVHNHLGSLLATIKVNINGIEDDQSERFKTISSLVDQACNDIRDMSHSLNMGISKDFGLVPALQELVDHLQHSKGLEIEFGASMQGNSLDPQIEIVVYRIIQELVSNVLNHAEATRLSISLTLFEEEQLINILVDDNGKGYNTEKREKKTEGMGIQSIQNMVDVRNGEIRFDSNSTSGTTVDIDLPISSN